MTTGGTPWYIDQDAKHSPRLARVLGYLGTRGGQGVLDGSHCKVSALGTPGAFVTIDPGMFSVLNKATGGAYEAYFDKIGSQISLPVSPTPAATRTDLVILRVENPYAGGVGTGSWSIPADPVNGPYWSARVIEGVTPTYITDVTEWNATWSAISLARIRRTNSSIVQAADITDLRSLISTPRTVVVNNPAPESPPVAQQIFTSAKEFGTVTTLAKSVTTFTNYPSGGWFDVPVPSWAGEVDINGLFTPQFDGSIWAEARLLFGSNAGPSTFADENPPGSPWQRLAWPLLGTYTVPSNQRGTIVRVQLQIRHLDPPNHTGQLSTRRGVYVSLWLNFKRIPE
jgi:hypothetical protein